MSFYQTLLRIAVEHRYNSSGGCHCLDFRPTPETRATFERAGLLLHETADGIQLACDRDRLEALQMMADDEQEDLSFDFRVFARDPEFRAYSEPFADASDQILYFDNRAATGSGDFRLSAAESVSRADFRDPGAAELEDVLERQDRLKPPEFVVRLYARSDRGPLLRQWLESPDTVYRIGFDSRRRYWKYYLLGRVVNNGSGQGFFIDDADKSFEFESIGEETLANRKRAFTFRSRQQIPLHERYQYRFQLKKKGQNGDTVVIPSLPFASVRQVGRETVADQQAIVSEIYINS